MALSYKVTNSGQSNPLSKHSDYTVVFDTQNIKEEDIKTIREEVEFLTHHREVKNGVYRVIHLFIKNHSTIVLFKYEDLRSDYDRKIATDDFTETMEHFIHLLEVFNKSN